MWTEAQARDSKNTGRGDGCNGPRSSLPKVGAFVLGQAASAPVRYMFRDEVYICI